MMCTRNATSTDLDDIVHRRRRLDHLPHPPLRGMCACGGDVSVRRKGAAGTIRARKQ